MLPTKLLMFGLLMVQLALGQNAMKPKLIFNHQTLYVTDLQRSGVFYEKVLGLDTIAEPFHDNRHIWLRIGDHSQLHVVLGAKEVIAHDINIHLAFSVASLEAFMANLNSMHVKFGNFKGEEKSLAIRADGIKQIYLQDPDGYWIEVNNSTF